MNKKIYCAPEMVASTFEEEMIIATSDDTINFYDNPANNEMESKSFSYFDFRFDEGLTNE